MLAVLSNLFLCIFIVRSLLFLFVDVYPIFSILFAGVGIEVVRRGFAWNELWLEISECGVMGWTKICGCLFDGRVLELTEGRWGGGYSRLSCLGVD